MAGEVALDLWPFESSLAIAASAAGRANVRRQPIAFHPRIACFGERDSLTGGYRVADTVIIADKRQVAILTNFVLCQLCLALALFRCYL